MSLENCDPEIYNLINEEAERQNKNIELIASENFTDESILEAAGSILTNKYAEGYPGARHYSGCEVVDKIEQIAIDRACSLFNAKYANVQPYSGSSANIAVLNALCNLGDTIMSLHFTNGGHFSHGDPGSLNAKLYKSTNYSINPETELLDYDSIMKEAKRQTPKVLIAGYSSYPRTVDFAKFREIANEVGALLLVDMAHISGLVAAGEHPSPIPYADVVTSTTHKTLRGPRGGMILTNNKDLAQKIDESVFPACQGGPLVHIIAAKAICYKLCKTAEFKTYIKNVINNSKALAKGLEDGGLRLVTGGTDNHLCIADLSKANITGKAMEIKCENKGITLNSIAIPNDPDPLNTSGIRVGTAALTTKGYNEEQCYELGLRLAKIAFN